MRGSREFEDVFASYHQIEIAGSEALDRAIYVTGGRLLHVSSDTALTVMTGLHTGPVRVRLAPGAATRRP